MPKKDKTAEDEGIQKDSKDEAHEEESELIEILEEEQEEEIPVIDESGFREFLQSSTSSAIPVLEEVTGAQEGPVFFATGRREQIDEKIEGDDPFKYANQGGQNREDPKYVNMSDAGGPLERINIEDMGREREQIQEVQLIKPTERGTESRMYEKKRDAEAIDSLKVGTQKALEEEKKKQHWIK